MKIPKGTPFQEKVWRALSKIPRGQVRTYAEIARSIEHPRAARAAANACGANPTPITIPCHRAVPSDGSLGGYSGPGGATTKRRLLQQEGVALEISQKRIKLVNRPTNL